MSTVVLSCGKFFDGISDGLADPSGILVERACSAPAIRRAGD